MKRPVTDQQCPDRLRKGATAGVHFKVTNTLAGADPLCLYRRREVQLEASTPLAEVTAKVDLKATSLQSWTDQHCPDRRKGEGTSEVQLEATSPVAGATAELHLKPINPL